MQGFDPKQRNSIEISDYKYYKRQLKKAQMNKQNYSI